MVEKTTQRRQLLKILATGGTTALAGCSSGNTSGGEDSSDGGSNGGATDSTTGEQTPTPEPEKVDFSIARVPFASTGSHYMPLQWGKTSPTGRVGELEWKVAYPGQITKLVRAKNVDVAEASLGAHLINHDRGVAYDALVTDNHTELANGLFAHADSGISEPQDIEGKKIGIHSESSASVIYTLGILANRYDVDLSNVTFLNKAIPELWGLIQKGEIDATVLFANFWYFGKEHEEVNEIFNTNGVWEDWVGGRTIFQLVVAHPKFLSNNSGIDVDIVESLRESRRYRNDNLKKVLDEYIKQEEADANLEFLLKQAKNLDVTFDLREEDRNTIEKFIELAHQQGVIDSAPTVDDIFTDTIDEVGHVDNPNVFE